MDVSDRIKAMEPLIRILSKNSWIKGMDEDDVAQELRIALIPVAERYNPEKDANWNTFAAPQLRFRMIDLYRSKGPNTRGGNPRGVPIKQAPAKDNFGNEFRLDCKDPLSTDAIDAVDWADLIERTETESKPVRIAVLWASGLSQKQLAEVFQVSPSRISQILKMDREDIVERLEFLVEGKR
jgi:RNA polymerase sigma factor (sigma-70 family)